MSIVILIIGFLIGVVTGIRWAYHDMEVADKKWKALNAPNNKIEDKS